MFIRLLYLGSNFYSSVLAIFSFCVGIVFGSALAAIELLLCETCPRLGFNLDATLYGVLDVAALEIIS